MSEEPDLLGGDNRPNRYIDPDGTIVYRASSLGGCDRALIAAGSAYSPMSKPEWFQAVLDEGTNAEPYINAQWEERTGIATTRKQERVELLIGVIDGNRVIVRGSIDGAEGLEPTLREYKKFRDSTWPEFLRKGVEVQVYYPWQVSAYMYAGGFDRCEFVGGHYVADYYGTGLPGIIEVEPKQLANPPIPLKAIKLKIARIERAINSGQHPCETACPDPLMYPCAYYYLHDDEDDRKKAKADKKRKELDALPRVDDENIIAFAREIRDLTTEATDHDRLAKDKRGIAKELYVELRGLLKATEDGEGAVMLDKYKVAWGMDSGRAGYPVAAKPPAPFIKVEDTEAVRAPRSKGREKDQ